MYIECTSAIEEEPVIPITAPFNVKKIECVDDTSINVSIPSGTDFIILMQLSYSSSSSAIAKTGTKKMMGMVNAVNQTVSITDNFYDGTWASNTTTLKWNSSTSAKVTRASSQGWAWIISCVYI